VPDYVIVGAGSAGCVLANRLSADPAVSVTLIEAGSVDRSPLLHVPAGMLTLAMRGLYQWPYQTTPQTHMDGRVLYSPRGKVLGGSSSINGMTYSRGRAEDYDGWAEAGNPGWSYAEVLPYFKRAETYLPGANAFHGADGPIQVSRPGIVHPLTKIWLQAGAEAGLPYTEDHSGAQFEGLTPMDMTAARGRRSSTSVAYLRPIRGRRNLTVITGAQATRILLEGRRATGVEYLLAGKAHRLPARKELILCLGAVASPQLLMLSGIGDPAHLQAHGITPLIELPGVGENLQDHLSISVKQACTQPISLFDYFNPFKAGGAMLRYLLFRDGPLGKPGTESLAFLKTLPEHAAPDVEFFFVLMLYQQNGREMIKQHGFQVVMNILRPESRGTLRLRSNDPLDMPALDPNFLSSAEDRRMLRDGIRLARRIFAQPAFAPYRGAELNPGADVQSDAALDAYLRAQGEAFYHSVGTCKMGNDAEAVVDGQLRVHGAEALRVVDASIMPRMISGNTNMPVIMIAEKAADMVLGKPALAPAAPAAETGVQDARSKGVVKDRADHLATP
jgi:choline dehydrogenase